MYESFFQLKQKPFELTPNPHFLYRSASYRKAMTYLEYGLQERAGFMVLTGEVGSGKTTLIRHLMKGLDDRISLSKVFNTRVNAQQMIAMICEDFGLEIAGKDKVQLLRDLNEFLIKEYQQQRRSLLVIDEAQNLTPDLLEEVRMLSNLETDDSKLLQILLVGQPELAKVLSLTELRQLRQRISIVCQLYPLSRQEMAEYIFHRMEVAGNRSALQIAPEAMDSMYNYSGGIPRLVNIVCGFALLTAFTEDSRVVSGEMAADIISGLDPQETIKQQEPGQDRKRTLLKALGHEPESPELPEGQAAGGKSNLKILLKEMSLRIAAVEKECDRLAAPDLSGIHQRIVNLEKAYTVIRKHLEATLARMQKPDTGGPTPIKEEQMVSGKESGLSQLLPMGKAATVKREKEGRQ